MKRIFLVTITVLASHLTIFSQSSSISGKVFNSDSSITIPGVNIYIPSLKKGTSTNGNGYFEIKGLSGGDYTILISSVGYQKIERVIHLKDEDNLELIFKIKESITELKAVSILADRDRLFKDIPGSMAYISPKELEKFEYTDINRTLRNVPGINMQEEDGFGLRPNIGLRGTGVERSSKITIMEDGVLMAPAPYAAPAAYYFPTIGRMNGVEVLKGSSQIKYGPYTTGGAINFISTPIPSEFSGKVSLLGGTFEGRNLHAHVGNSHKNVAYMVESFQYGSDGFKTLDNGGNTGFTKSDYLAKVRVNTNATAKFYQSLTFKIGQTVETSNETYLGLTEKDFEKDPYRRYSASQVDQMNTEQTQYSLSHLIQFSDKIKLNTTAYRTNFSRNWYKIDKVKDSLGNSIGIADLVENPNDYNDAFDILGGQSSTIDDAIAVKANNRDYYSQGVQTVLGLDFQQGSLLHSIDLGLRIHKDQIDRFQWVDDYAMEDGSMQLTNAGTKGTESNRVETANALASYIQYQLSYEKWTFIPGLRYENITMTREDYGKNDPSRTGVDLNERENLLDVFIPGVSIDYDFNKYLNLFVGVHKGFAPPGSREETEAEESINYEIGSRYAKNSLALSLVLFYNDYTNLLGSDLNAAGGDGTGDLFNGGEATSNGIEFLLMYDLLASQETSKFGLPLTISYTYTNATFENDFISGFEGWGQVNSGDQLPYIANNQLAVGLGIDHPKFAINLNGRYMDAMRTSPGQDEIPTNEGTDDYFVIDVSANYKLDQHFNLFANALNITNEIYSVARRPAGLRPGMPRAFNLGIKANF